MVNHDKNQNINNYEILNQVKNDSTNSYYETLDENFNQALNLFESELNQNELISMLEDGNIVQKQIAALKLTKIQNTTEAKILADNLVGQDGKIREAVSLKVHELIQNPQYSMYFQDENICDIFLNAIIDVNSNVCRNIISSVSKMKTNKHFCEYFTQKLTELTYKLLEKVKQFDFQDGKYKVNKEVFKLYWCLETIYEFTDCICLETLKNILTVSKDINEYTIREKTAKILSKNFDDPELNNIRNTLKNDKNYYVRRFWT